MKDRQPLHAGRVHLEPVNGQQNTFDMTMADGATEQGTPLNKATFLKDATAALYGLPNTAVPDDVFSWLGRYAEYCWNRRSYVVTYTENKNALPSSGRVVVMDSEVTRTIQYSNSITYDTNANKAILVNPISVTLERNLSAAQQLASLAPCYITGAYEVPNAIFYIPAGATSMSGGSGATVCYVNNTVSLSGSTALGELASKLITVTNIQTSLGDWELVFSTNRSAYPDSGIQDEYEYEYIGIPFDNLPTAPKIETGSYVGTGTIGGWSNHMTFTFGFVPKVVLFSGDSRPEQCGGRVYCFGLSSSLTSYAYCVNCIPDVSNNSARLNSNVLELYNSSSSDPRSQFNGNGITYKWIAIG